MKARIFISLDTKCMSKEKLEKRIFGGAELFFLLLKKYLLKKGYIVEHWPNEPNGVYDLCLHSNEFNHDIKARRHVIWAGSWTAMGAEHADKAIVLTNYMKSKLSKEWQDAYVIPAPFNRELYNYADEERILGKIVCTSNPNRHYLDTIAVSQELSKRDIGFSIHLCGGNKLYSESFPESHNFDMPGLNIHYCGPLPRHQMIQLLASSQIFSYPAFSDWAETQSVAPIEAMALGIPTVLPNREPFIELSREISPKPYLCNTIEEFCDTVYDLLKQKITHVPYDVSFYSEERIFAMILQIIEDTIK